MKYATWRVYLPTQGSVEGTTPEETIRSAGKVAEGGFFTSDFDIVGYVGDDVTATGLSDWKFKIISQSKALDLATAKNSDSYFAEDGRIVLPLNDPATNGL
jgi:hypothetical protein